MNYEKIGDNMYFPKSNRSPLESINEIKFSYHINSEIKGEFIEAEITSKLFQQKEILIKKSTYRIKISEIEDCVKTHIKKHMLELGIRENFIPHALRNFNMSKQPQEFKSTA